MQPPPPAPPSPPHAPTGTSPGKVVAIVLGVIFGTLLLCCGGLALFGRNLWQSGLAADKEAKAFATESVRVIGKEWDTGEMERRASPAWRAQVRPEDTAKLFASFRRKLGPLKSVQEFTTKNYKTFSGTSGASTTLELTAPATFEKADGQIQMTVVNQDGKWGIQYFRVNSSVFSE